MQISPVSAKADLAPFAQMATTIVLVAAAPSTGHAVAGRATRIPSPSSSARYFLPLRRFPEPGLDGTPNRVARPSLAQHAMLAVKAPAIGRRCRAPRRLDARAPPHSFADRRQDLHPPEVLGLWCGPLDVLLSRLLAPWPPATCPSGHALLRGPEAPQPDLGPPASPTTPSEYALGTRSSADPSPSALGGLVFARSPRWKTALAILLRPWPRISGSFLHHIG